MKTVKDVVKGTSFFSMDIIKEIAEMSDFEKAAMIARESVRNSSAKEVNKKKAVTAIEKAFSVEGLAITMTNFFLAHPSEGLGTIKLEM